MDWGFKGQGSGGKFSAKGGSASGGQVSGRKIKDSQLIKRIKRMGEVILWMEGITSFKFQVSGRKNGDKKNNKYDKSQS